MAKVLLFLSVVLIGLAGTQARAGVPLTLVYTGNLDGELEPCGCAVEGDMGGLKRHGTVIDQLRAASPSLFLVSSGGLLSSYHAHERITGQFILKAIATFGYDGVGVQWSDLAYGPGFITAHALPWVSSNWRGTEFQAERRIEKGAHKLALFSWLDPAASPQTDIRAGGNPADPERESIQAAISRAKDAGYTTLLLTTLPAEQLRAEFSLARVDVVLLKSKYEVYGEPALQEGTLFLQPGSRGMRFARVDIDLDAQGKVAAFRHEVIPMPPSVKDSPRLQQWYDDYNAEVKAAYERSVAIRKANDSGTRRYVGARSCESCHPSQYQKWATTRHSHAYEALERVNKAFDPDCIRCHTVGFDQDGGFIDKDVTEHLSNVQCENCHGSGRDHVAAQGMKPLANAGWEKTAMCAQCHVPKHSPAFAFDQYWPKIAH